MFDLSVRNTRARLVASMLLGLVVLAAAGFAVLLSSGSPALDAARDYEECAEFSQASAGLQHSPLPSNNAQGGTVLDCNVRFAGRRKQSGGYTYYDFMQDRSFDIAGPNPTAEERRRIDHEYMGFLDTQRRENIATELAKRQDVRLRADVERAPQSVGRPLDLAPKAAVVQVSRRLPDRAKPPRCEDNSLACGWSKLSTAVKSALASSSRAKP